MSDNPNIQRDQHDDKKDQTLQQDLREMAQHISDVLKLMRSQRDILRQRNITLPSDALDNLRLLKRQVDTLVKTIIDSQGELRSLRALASTTALINSTQSVDEVLNQVMDTVIALTGAERGYIVLKNKTTGELEFRVARGMDQSQLDGSQGMIISSTIVNKVADSGEPVLTDNASQDERYQGQDSIVGFALRSILAVPLKVRDDVIGVVYCDNRFLSGLFKQSELQILNAFANQAAVAIENARLFERARMRLNEVSEMRERMDNLFTSVASGIITTDSRNRIIISNAAAQEIFGMNKLSGHQLEDVLPPMGDEFDQALERVLNDGTQELLDVKPVISGRGERYWTVVMSPLRDADTGKMQGLTMAIDDLTEQKAGETQIRAVRRYLPLALVDSIHSIEQLTSSGQERDISALFADVRGFTSFSERLEPDELMTVINKYLSLASDAINLYDGIVDKYLGDAVTGLFNTQLNPQADHAKRAVQAAMQLILDLHAQHEVMIEDERLFYGIGVHSGPAFLGNVGGKNRKEFAAIGEAQDIAKYLQEQAGPGEVMISEATYKQIQDTFECEPCEEIKRPKKGFEHVRFYRVVRRKKGAVTESLFIDDELLELLKEDD